MRKLKLKSREEFIELMEKVGIYSLVSIEVVTYTGSYLEGIDWDHLKYVYDRGSDKNESEGWITYTTVYREPVSAETLISDFDELREQGTGGERSPVIVTLNDGLEQSTRK